MKALLTLILAVYSSTLFAQIKLNLELIGKWNSKKDKSNGAKCVLNGDLPNQAYISNNYLYALNEDALFCLNLKTLETSCFPYKPAEYSIIFINDTVFMRNKQLTYYFKGNQIVEVLNSNKKLISNQLLSYDKVYQLSGSLILQQSMKNQKIDTLNKRFNFDEDVYSMFVIPGIGFLVDQEKNIRTPKRLAFNFYSANSKTDKSFLDVINKSISEYSISGVSRDNILFCHKTNQNRYASFSLKTKKIQYFINSNMNINKKILKKEFTSSEFKEFPINKDVDYKLLFIEDFGSNKVYLMFIDNENFLRLYSAELV